MEEILEKLIARMQTHPALLALLRQLPPEQDFADSKDWAATILATILYQDAVTAAPQLIGDSLIQFARQLAAAQNPINENCNPRDPALRPLLDRPLSPAAQARKDQTDPDRWYALQSFGDAMLHHYLKYQNYGGYLTGMLTVNPWQALALPQPYDAAPNRALELVDRREDAVWDAPGPPSWITRHLYGQTDPSPSGQVVAKYTVSLPLYALDVSLQDGAESVLAEPAPECRPGARLDQLRSMSSLLVGDALFCVLLIQYAAQKGPHCTVNELELSDSRAVHLKCMEKKLITSRGRYGTVSALYKALSALAELPEPQAPVGAATLRSDLAQAPGTPWRTWLVFFSYRHDAPLFDPGRVEIVTRMPALPDADTPLEFTAIGAHKIGAAERRYRIDLADGPVALWDAPAEAWQPYAAGARFVPVDAALLTKILGDAPAKP